MILIVPFQEEFCQEIHTVFYVNRDTQGTHGSCTTTSERCPHCGNRNIFKVFDVKSEREEEGWFIETYDCKCPQCRNEFDLEVEHEME